MFARILLPLDGSDIAETALPYGQELARRLGSELVLYHVHTQEHKYEEHMHRVYLNSVAESVRNSIGKNTAKVTTVVEAGDPTDNICNIVDKNKLDLIVMTAVSASGLKVGKMLGSVTDQVCRTVSIPVMLVRPGNLRQIDPNGQLLRRLFVPLDGSELSMLALPLGEELATRLKLSTTLFQMATMIRLYDDGISSGGFVDYAKFNDEEKNRVSAEMKNLENGLRQKGLDVTSIVVTGFDAAYEIIEMCKKTGADLVVMSTHGRTGLGRWVFGNVAEKVLRHGETPLLLVHSRAG